MELTKSLTITKGIKIDVYDLFIMWYLYEKSLVFTGPKVSGQKWPIKSGRWKKCVVKMKTNLKSSAVGKFKEALDVFPDTLSVPLCLPRKELHGLPKVLYL